MKRYYIFPLALMFFSCWGRVDKSKLLGHDYRLFQISPIEELANAVRDNDKPAINEIVRKARPNLNYQEEKFGHTLLMLTVQNEQYEICKQLLELGADPNIHDHSDGSSAIIDASKIYGKGPDFVKLLLAHGANPNDEEVGKRLKGNTRRETPLLNASAMKLETVRLLVEAGADINHKGEYPAVTPLNQSLIMERYDVAMYLLEKGAEYTIPIFIRREKDTPKGKEIYIQDYFRELMHPLASEQYKWKMKIAEFLLSRGINYRKVPIPDLAVEKAKELYPNNWEEYLKNY